MRRCACAADAAGPSVSSPLRGSAAREGGLRPGWRRPPPSLRGASLRAGGALRYSPHAARRAGPRTSEDDGPVPRKRRPFLVPSRKKKPLIDINCFNQLSVQNTTGSTVYLLDEAELFTHEVSKGKAAIKVMERDEHGALSEVVTINLQTKDDGEGGLFDDAHTALTDFMAKVIAAQKAAKKAAKKAGTARPPLAAAPAAGRRAEVEEAQEVVRGGPIRRRRRRRRGGGGRRGGVGGVVGGAVVVPGVHLPQQRRRHPLLDVRRAPRRLRPAAPGLHAGG